MIRLLAIAIISFVILLPDFKQTFAQGNLHVPYGKGLDINVFLITAGVRNDNIFKSEGETLPTATKSEGELKDEILAVSPGIQLSYPHGTTTAGDWDITSFSNPKRKFNQKTVDGLSFGAAYTPTLHYYRNNAGENIQTHRAKANLKYKFSNGLIISLKDDYKDSESEASTRNERDPSKQRVLRTPKKTNKANFKIKMPLFEKLDTEFHYKNEEVESEFERRANKQISNRNDHTVGFILSSALLSSLPKMSFQLKYDYGMTNFEKDHNTSGVRVNSDSHFNDIRGGIKWKGTGKTTISFDAGARFRDYDLTSTKDFKGFVSTLKANIHDFIVPLPSIFSFKLDEFEIKGSRKQNEAGTTQSFNEDDNEIVSTFSEANSGSIKIKKNFAGFFFVDEVSFSPKMTYKTTRYSGEKNAGTDTALRRFDEEWSVGASLLFVLNEYSAFEIGYIHKDKDSNQNTSDYRQNLITFGMGYSY